MRVDRDKSRAESAEGSIVGRLVERELDIRSSLWRRPPRPRDVSFGRLSGAPLFWKRRTVAAGSRRERLRRVPCGEGLGRQPGALAERLNHIQIGI
ncbi:hypothetical protein KUCAC02_016912 [Chaenocephalus aceratus]|nr:hypothetical protein KUCAC02_016912 [Chaenocephalus aceratus]